MVRSGFGEEGQKPPLLGSRMKFSPGTGLDVMLCGGGVGGNQAVLLGEKEENATFLLWIRRLLDIWIWTKVNPQSKKVRKGGVHMKNMWDIRWRNRSPRQEADFAG